MPNRAIAAGVFIAGLALGSTAANANLLLNPGFETGDFTNWTTSGTASLVMPCALFFVGCAPSGGSFGALINAFGEDGNSSISQSVTLPGAGSYSFGAHLSFGTDNAAGNFDQGQTSLTVQIAGGPSETVGFDPNSLNGQFTIPGNLGFSFTDWMLLSDTLVYSGVGPANALININIQDFSNSGGLSLIADNIFVQAAAVPEPTTLVLLASGLLGLGALRRRSRN